MISYPGEILMRFGRYEAVEKLGPRGKAEIWKAWDPYLERFVLVAGLTGIEQTELYRARGDMQGLLGRWLGAPGEGRILDFGSPESGAAAFFILELKDPETADRVATPPYEDARSRVSAPNLSPARRGGLILGFALALGVGAMIGSILARLDGVSDDGRPPAASSAGVATIAAVLTPIETSQPDARVPP